MELQTIESSMLLEVGTDGRDLVARFKNGKLYRYIGAAHELQAMLASDSAGRYLNSVIKSNYTAEQVS